MSPGGEKLIADMVSIAGLKRGETLLDIGCGDGDTVAILSERYGLICTGIDSSVKMIEQGRASHPGLDLRVYQTNQTAKSIYFEGIGAFDAVLFQCSLSVMDDMAGAVRSASKLLEAGGALIIADLCSRSSTRSPGEEIGSNKAAGIIDTDELDAVCRSCGIDPIGRSDRTSDLDTFAAEVILSHGSLTAYFNNICNGDALSAFCRLDPASPPPGYFLAVYRMSL
jgi:SAM-dependent methyltransferase